jgi:hypothetical protein
MPHPRRVILLALLLGAACGKRAGIDACPPGMRVVAERSTPGKATWCKSADGRAAQWTEMHPSAERRQVCLYQEGRPDGPFLAYHPGGKRWIEGAFTHGLKDGAWHQWHTDGSLVAEGEYRAGRLVAGAPVAIAARCEDNKP